MPQTQTIDIQPDSDMGPAIAQAVQTLQSGGLVAFPTETVYGLGARADLPDAVAKLRRVKQRADDKPFTVHLGSPERIEQFVPQLNGPGKRLAAKGWPGPLTLIFAGIEPANAPVMQNLPPQASSAIYHDGTVGLRCPDHPVATALLDGLQAPVIAASANSADAPPPINADQVLATLDGQIDLLLDAGPARYGQASTIVKLEQTGYQILRPGVFDRRTIARLASLNILLVCTGNTCRSPMAAALARQIIARRLDVDPASLADRGITVSSAGTFASTGAQAAAPAIQALNGRNLDLTHHRSQGLTVELINRADHIYAMTESHRSAVGRMVPSAIQRVQLIDPHTDIADPIGQSVEVYRACAETLASALEHRIQEVPL